VVTHRPASGRSNSGGAPTAWCMLYSFFLFFFPLAEGRRRRRRGGRPPGDDNSTMWRRPPLFFFLPPPQRRHAHRLSRAARYEGRLRGDEWHQATGETASAPPLFFFFRRRCGGPRAAQKDYTPTPKAAGTRLFPSLFFPFFPFSADGPDRLCRTQTAGPWHEHFRPARCYAAAVCHSFFFPLPPSGHAGKSPTRTEPVHR